MNRMKIRVEGRRREKGEWEGSEIEGRDERETETFI